MIRYPDVVVLSMSVNTDSYTTDLLFKLKGVQKQIGIKGGVAREMLRVSLGFAKTHSPEKINDLDIAIFEDPMPTREQRIARRDEYAAQIENADPKDLEFLPSGELGISHYFLTRDVTMNEVLVFMSNTGFTLMYTPECRDALRDRIIKPSIHCAHSGLDYVWVPKDGKPVIHPNITRRCIYRKIKGDGDTYDFAPFSIKESIGLFDVDLLFKVSKRFMHDPMMFAKCCDALIELGFAPEDVHAVQEMSADYINKPAKVMTSEKVEDLLELMQQEFCNWRIANQAPYFHTTAKVIFE
jgi:hypothetical protein